MVNGRRAVLQICTSFGRRGLVQAILEEFYGTAVMVMVTWNTVYCLFPRTTFARVEMFTVKRLTAQEREAVAKYERRGWKRSSMPSEREVTAARRVGDSMTWTMCFDEGGSVIDRVVEEDDSIRRCRFSLGERGMTMLRQLSI